MFFKMQKGEMASAGSRAAAAIFKIKIQRRPHWEKHFNKVLKMKLHKTSTSSSPTEQIHKQQPDELIFSILEKGRSKKDSEDLREANS